MKRHDPDRVVAYLLLIPLGIAGVFAGVIVRFICSISDISYFAAREILSAKEYNHGAVKRYLQRYPDGYASTSIKGMLDQYALRQVSKIGEEAGLDELLKLKDSIAGSSSENTVSDVVKQRFGAFGEAVLLNTAEGYRAYIARDDADLREEAFNRWERHEITENAAGRHVLFSNEIKDRILKSGRGILTVSNMTDMRITLKLHEGVSILPVFDKPGRTYNFLVEGNATCAFVLVRGEYSGMARGSKMTTGARRLTVSHGFGGVKVDLREGEDKIELKIF